MTRIVAGQARGRRLAVPPQGTRPTADRAREGLFNTLASLMDFTDAHVLDLYAGSGAVGLEALSRGAASAVFVESQPAAQAVLQANITQVGLGEAQIVRSAVDAYLRAASSGPFDLIFADPPYALGEIELRAVLEKLKGDEWSRPGTVIVVERSARGEAPVWPDPLETVKQKRYGEAVFWYGRRR